MFLFTQTGCTVYLPLVVVMIQFFMFSNLNKFPIIYCRYDFQLFNSNFKYI